MKFNKYDAIGSFCMTLAIYLWFFDEIPFAVPWGFPFAAVGLLCLKAAFKERMHHD